MSWTRLSWSSRSFARSIASDGIEHVFARLDSWQAAWGEAEPGYHSVNGEGSPVLSRVLAWLTSLTSSVPGPRSVGMSGSLTRRGNPAGGQGYSWSGDARRRARGWLASSTPYRRRTARATGS